MAVTWNNNLGAFQVNGRGFYATREAAQAADTTAAEAAPLAAVTSDEFRNVFSSPVSATAPQAPATNVPLVQSNRAKVSGYTQPKTASGGATYDPAAQQRAFESGNIGGAGGAYNAGDAESRAYWDAVHRTNNGSSRETLGGVVKGVLNSTPVKVVRSIYDLPYLAAQVGKAILPDRFTKGIDTAANVVSNPIAGSLDAAGAPDAVQALVDPTGYARQIGTGNLSDGSLGPSGPIDIPVRAGDATGQIFNEITGQGGPAQQAPNNRDGGGAGGGAPAGTTGDQLADAELDTNEAERDWRGTEAENSDENANLWSNLWEQYDKVDDADYGLSDEARGYQREGLQQQRMLLERMLGFDPNQYATQFADQALARTVAAGRSGPGGFAAQQAGMFAANEQAPALYAEGARMAAGLENQRLQAAAGVAKTFGELGTMTRGQDETRAQFDATLPLELAKAMTNATQGQVAMNEQESQRFADIYMNFAQLQATYAGMSSQEQMAWWDREMAQKGLDQQWNMFKQELAQQGKITAKDILGGVFSLGGAAITGGGSILAARAARGA